MTAAEGMDLATGADIAASALRGFGMSADEMNRVADVLAKTSSASNTSISLLGESLKYVAKPAAALGFTIEQTNAMLGAMANSGIKGSQAGTALRAAFLRLSKEPKAVADALAELGVSSKTTEGNLRPLPELMLDLSKKLAGMGTGDKMKYLANIFGSEAATGMLAVMEAAMDTSDKGLAALERALYGCSGAAKEMADRMNATAQGALKRLESASEGMRIAIGNHLLPVYTKAIDLMAQFKSWLTQLIEEHPIISKAVIGLTAAILGLSGAALILLGGLASIGGMIKMWPLLKATAGLALTSIRSQVKMAITSFSGLGSAFAKWRVPVVGMIALAGALYYAWRKNLWGIRDMVTAVTEGFKMAWSASTDGIAEIDDALAQKLKAAGILDYAIIVGQVFFRIRKFISGFIEGLKDSYNFVIGIFDWLKGIFSPVVESGQELLKFLGILKPATKSQTDTWRAWGQLLGRFAPAVIGVITAFKGMRIITGIFGDLGKAILGMFNLITAHPIIALITLIAGLAVYAYNHWEEITAYVSEKWQKLTGLCVKSVDWIKRKWQALKNLWNSWTLKDIFAPLIGWAVSVWNFVKRKWNEFWAWWDSTTLGDWFRPIKDFAISVYNSVKGKWQEFSKWWNSWKLFDVFAALGGYVDKAIVYVKDKWQKFTDWLSSLNPFKDWTPPTVDPEKAKTMKAETLQKYGTLDLRPAYMRGGWRTEIGNFPQPKTEQITQLERIVSTVSAVSKTTASSTKVNTISAEKIRLQFQDITVLNKMSETFAQRVAEMTQAWQPFKLSLGEGFTQIYTTMQEVADKIRGTVIPAVNELASALSRIASEISAVAQAENINVSMKSLNPATVSNVPVQYQQTVGGVRKRAKGGIITRPEFALIGEAGREAVIPLEDRVRGLLLWLEAGHELGMFPDRKTSSGVNTFTSAMISTENVNNSQGYSVMPQIVNALRFQPNVINTAGIQNRTQNISKSYARNVNALKPIPILNMILLNRLSPEPKESQSYSVMPEVINSMDTQRISQVYGAVTRIIKSPLLKSREFISSMAERSVMREFSGVNSSAHGSQVRNVIRRMAEHSILREASSRQITNNFAGMNAPVIPHAMGGIFSSPHIGLIAEAGREAVIPLEDRTRGIPLLIAAANEIGGADFITNKPYSMPMLIQQVQNQTAFQTAERQSESRGKIAVNVDVKPSDVYIDGERIGRISYRWSERQTIRSGLDS